MGSFSLDSSERGEYDKVLKYVFLPGTIKNTALVFILPPRSICGERFRTNISQTSEQE